MKKNTLWSPWLFAVVYLAKVKARMMKYYQEITFLPEPEISLSYIWQNVFQQVHIAMADLSNKLGENHIGVSFPQYGDKEFPLGAKLRIFAESSSHLDQLDLHRWLNRLTDYVHIKTIHQVPHDAKHVCFTRKQVKGSARIERDMQSKALLWSKKSGDSLTVCLEQLEKTKPKPDCTLPYVYLHSQQTKQRSPDANSKFPLYIEKTVYKKPQEGLFNCYGLSVDSSDKSNWGTVPQF
jgi:CRISPR-associated endonuclease Csy4